MIVESLLVIFLAGVGIGALSCWAVMVWREDRRAHDLRKPIDRYQRGQVFRRDRRRTW